MNIKYYEDNLQKNENFGIKIEEKWDLKADSFNLAQQNDKTEFATKTLKFLKEKNIIQNANVLDIGGGSGRYAIPFAKYAKHVVVTDISQNMLYLASENAKKENILNISFRKSVWDKENINSSENEKFDLVFAAMCPALRTPQGLYNMIKSSKKYCLINQFVKDTDTFVEYILSETGLKREHHPHNDRNIIYSTFNILWLHGYNPEINYLYSNITFETNFFEIEEKYKSLLIRIENETNFDVNKLIEKYLNVYSNKITTDVVMANILWDI
ncbi:class I SAM-dependent methyltransferase [Caviibacter abscessus]|uniref:class I SAM-dependent methyltransferase n=1 Tax=Caviibacter abscessus TaxID=1766719 RepID=UPI0008332793|nr:class I SAM-dependent methyltransferase [Caviibacter abscessus]